MKIKEFGSEFDLDSNIAFLQSPAEYISDVHLQKFRSGRDALKAIALFYHRQTKKVLIPVLCCESMVIPFLMSGYEVVFYKINSNYTADVDDIEKNLEKGCIFLYMSYFGIDAINDSYLRKWKRNLEIISIEDRTQNILIERDKKGFLPDITISSIRKWLALPDGALLWANENYMCNAINDDRFSDIRERAMRVKSLYLSEGVESLKDTYLSLFQSANRMLDENLNIFSISRKSEMILRQIDFNKIFNQREQNVKILKQNLDIAKEKKLLAFITENPEKSTLYFPILVEKRDEVQKLLAKEKIYCPVIWPLPCEAKRICSVADYTEKHMLAIPCDQRYSVEDMVFISEKVIKVLKSGMVK